MGYKLSPEERRIIERTKREGEELYASQTRAQKKKEIWKSVFTWAAVIFAFVIFALFIYYAGTFL